MNYEALALIAAGVFGVAGALFDWEWFMNSHKARWVVGLCGREGARLFYAFLGTALIVGGLLMQFGVIEVGRRS